MQTKLLWDFIWLLTERLRSIKEMSIHACEKMAKVEHLIIIARMQTSTFFMEITGGFSSEAGYWCPFNVHLYISLAYSQRTLSYYINTCSYMCIIGLVTIVRFRKQPRGPLTFEYIMKISNIYIILLLSKK